MKIENISKVMLAFENCEDITIPATDVKFLYMSEITESVRIHNILRENKSEVSRGRTAGYVRMLITDKEEYQRLKAFNDVAQIHLFDDEGNDEWFFVYWGGDEYDNSAHQMTKIFNGDIDLIITEDLTNE